MSVLVDLQVVRLLGSRMCHDLISPVSAVNAGMEVLEDSSGDLVADSLMLIKESAGQAARKLAFYRAAYGVGQQGPKHWIERVRGLIDGYCEDGRIAVRWSAIHPEAEALASPGTPRLVLNLILLAFEALPRGGEIFVSLAPMRRDGRVMLGLALKAVGETSQLRDDVRDALTGDVPTDELTVYTVQAYFAAKLVEELTAFLEVSPPRAGQVTIAALVAKGDS